MKGSEALWVWSGEAGPCPGDNEEPGKGFDLVRQEVWFEEDRWGELVRETSQETVTTSQVRCGTQARAGE